MDAAPLKTERGIWPAAGLFFLSPLVAEFLLGNLPINMLPALFVLAPLYGGGALLIRELVRRAGRGWPSLVLLALAYGIVEEAYTTQSLFNPDYLKLNLHLLQPAYIPALGIGAWWTVFVLTLHTAWSVSTSIALVEATVPERAKTPWLGRTGLAITGVLFAVGVFATTRYQMKQDAFRASTAQLVTSGLICAVLIAVAFLMPNRRSTDREEPAPNPWIMGALGLAAGGAVLLVPSRWNWSAAAAILVIDLGVAAAVWTWSRRSGWGMFHKLALAGGAAAAYGVHAFIETPVVPGAAIVTRVGNVIFFFGALGLMAFAAKRTRASIEAAAKTAHTAA